jgi:hypothetical protein
MLLWLYPRSDRLQIYAVLMYVTLPTSVSRHKFETGFGFRRCELWDVEGSWVGYCGKVERECCVWRQRARDGEKEAKYEIPFVVGVNTRLLWSKESVCSFMALRRELISVPLRGLVRSKELEGVGYRVQIILCYYLLQLSCHSVAVVLALVQTKIRINIHKRNNTKHSKYK